MSLLQANNTNNAKMYAGKKKTRKRQRRNFNPKIDYIEDMDNLNRFEILLTIPSDPIWYRTILTSICLEVFYIFHEPMIYHKEIDSMTQKNIRVIEIVFNCMYALDILLTVLEQNIKELPINYSRLTWRPWPVIACDIIAILPLEQIIQPEDEHTKKFYYILKLIHAFKLIRLFYHFHRNKYELKSGYTTRLIQFGIILGIAQSAFLLTFHMNYCFRNVCYRETYCTVYEIISTKMNGKGCVVTFIPFYNSEIWTHDIPIIVGILVMQMLVLKPMICYMISGLICDHEHKINYVYKMNFFKKTMVPSFNISEETCKSVMNYFEAFWKQRGGFTEKDISNIMSVYSRSMQIEMAIDYSWTAFRHSGLFREREVYFLRFLTPLMKIELHMPGEFLYERNVMKNRMIYIAEGMVDVLSYENGKCGVFSLTSGSCLGESTLFFPYKSIVSFRCQTVCKIYVLGMDSFMLIPRKYPVIYKELLQQVWERYSEAKTLWSIKNRRVASGSNDLVRLKTTLHGLMSKDAKFKDDHQIKNIYLARDICYTYMNQSWNTRKYLDLLVLKDRGESKYDSVFIKSTGIWILRPNSPILKLWEYFIALLIITCTILIPYIICQPITIATSLMVKIIQLVWILDLLIQIIIPINDYSRARSIRSIFIERYETTLFVLDLISIFPGKIFVNLFHSDFNNEYLELNKLAKLYRLKKLFDELESHFKISILYMRFIKYFIMFSIQIYLISCLFVMGGIVPNLFSALSIQFSSGVGFDNSKNLNRSFVYVIANNAALVVELLAFVSITSAFYLRYVTKLWVSNFIDNLYACVMSKVANPQILQRLESFINTQLNENQGMMIVTTHRAYFNLPVYFDILTKSECHLKYLLKLDLFTNVSLEVLQKLTTKTTMMTFHKYANIVNRGVIYSDVYVLINGTCRTICEQSIYFTKPGVPINMLEISCGTPAVCTVIGLTEVSMLTFSYTHLLNLLKSDNIRLYENFRNTITARKKYTRRVLVKILKGERTFFIQRIDERKQSFHKFQNRGVADSFDEFDYYVPFDKLYPFGWIRFFLMPLTIFPEGAFLFYWDFSRSILAFVAGISYMILPISITRITSFGFIYFYALDATVFLDIYVRLHVCYYNKLGILIKHPLYTARHYFKNGFLGDLIGAIPFNLIQTECLVCKALLHFIRSVQMHRIIGFKCSYNKNTLPVNIIFALIWIIFIANTTASFIFAIKCDLKNNSLVCQYGTDPVQLYTYLCFVFTSVVTTTGLEGVDSPFIMDRTFIVIISILSVIAIFVKIFINGFLLSSYLKKDKEIFNYRTGMAHLFNWMKQEKSGKYLKKHIGIYYNLYWKKIGENNPFLYFENLNKSLKRDLFYSFYGEQLVKHSIFPWSSHQLEDLYKNFLLEMTPLIIPRDGYVLTINDIEENVYFLYSGDVEVVAADGTCLQKLNEGSLFGNLENTKRFRQKITIVANTHVQIFYLKTTTFYGIIEYFPDIKDNFLEQKSKYNYYIKSPLEKPNIEPDPMNLRKGIKLYKKFQIFKLLYESSLYIGLLVEIYQISVLGVHPIYILVQYVFDVLHIIYEVWKFFVGYLDENLDLVIDVKLIRSRCLKRATLAISILSSIPFDIPLIILTGLYPPSLNKYAILIIVLRLNRLLRIHNMLYFQKSRNAGPIRSVNMFSKLPILCYLIILASFTGSCIMLIFDRLIDDGGLYFLTIKNEQQVFEKIVIDMPEANKFHVFVRYLYFNIAISIFTSDENYMTDSIPKTCLISFYLIFWVVFQVIIFAEVMKISSEYSHSRINMLKVVKFYEHYSSLKDTSNIIKKKMYRGLLNIWSYTYNNNINILTNNCPRYLQHAVLYGVYGHVLYNNPIFHHTHIDFIRQLIGKINIVPFFVNDIIVYKNDERETIYFIHRGKVAVLLDESEYNQQAVEILEAGDCFGLCQGIFPNTVYDYTYRSITTCEIIELKLNKWIHLLDFFPATKEFIYAAAPEYEHSSSCRRIPRKTPKT